MFNTHTTPLHSMHHCLHGIQFWSECGYALTLHSKCTKTFSYAVLCVGIFFVQFPFSPVFFNRSPCFAGLLHFTRECVEKPGLPFEVVTYVWVNIIIVRWSHYCSRREKKTWLFNYDVILLCLGAFGWCLRSFAFQCQQQTAHIE